MPDLALIRWEVILHWTATLLYAMSTLAFVYGVNFDKEKVLSAGAVLAAVGLLPHSAGLIARWLAVGHGPYMTRGEVLSSNAWAALIVFLAVLRWRPQLKPAGLLIVPLAMLMTAAGLFLTPEIRLLPPSLRSFWLVLHVAFAKLGAAGMLISLAAAVLYLLKEGRPETGWRAQAPALDALDEYSGRWAGFGFAFWTIMIAAGAIWAQQSWGRYWAWDPIETWSLITWLLFGMHLHLRRFFSWSGRGAAWTLGACFLMSAFTVLGVPLITQGLHTEYFR